MEWQGWRSIKDDFEQSEVFIVIDDNLLYNHFHLPTQLNFHQVKEFHIVNTLFKVNVNNETSERYKQRVEYM